MIKDFVVYFILLNTCLRKPFIPQNPSHCIYIKQRMHLFPRFSSQFNFIFRDLQNDFYLKNSLLPKRKKKITMRKFLGIKQCFLFLTHKSFSERS